MDIFFLKRRAPLLLSPFLPTQRKETSGKVILFTIGNEGVKSATCNHFKDETDGKLRSNPTIQSALCLTYGRHDGRRWGGDWYAQTIEYLVQRSRADPREWCSHELVATSGLSCAGINHTVTPPREAQPTHLPPAPVQGSRTLCQECHSRAHQLDARSFRFSVHQLDARGTWHCRHAHATREEQLRRRIHVAVISCSQLSLSEAPMKAQKVLRTKTHKFTAE